MRSMRSPMTGPLPRSRNLIYLTSSRELQRAQTRRPDLTDDETKILITGWQTRLNAATEKVKIIDKLRGELVATLISLQGKEYYIEELIKLDEADKVLENLDAIVDDLGKTLNDLKDIQEKISS